MWGCLASNARTKALARSASSFAPKTLHRSRITPGGSAGGGAQLVIQSAGNRSRIRITRKEVRRTVDFPLQRRALFAFVLPCFGKPHPNRFDFEMRGGGISGNQTQRIYPAFPVSIAGQIEEIVVKRTVR